MKEAAGEANLTVIAIVLIAIVAAIATPLISNMMRGTADKSCCQQYGGVWRNGGCTDTGVVGVEFDESGYEECRAAGSGQQSGGGNATE